MTSRGKVLRKRATAQAGSGAGGLFALTREGALGHVRPRPRAPASSCSQTAVRGTVVCGPDGG
eukprot:3968874-Pyramimonas_sp.AAC.1